MTRRSCRGPHRRAIEATGPTSRPFTRATGLRSAHAAAALVAATALFAGACASSDAPAGPAYSGASGPVGTADDAGSPVSGGTLEFGSLALPASLDPALTMATGSTGGTEMAAVYDLLVRIDDDTGAVVPQLADDLTVSDDGLTWTLTLRQDVTFSNGRPVDADAVRWSIDRYIDNRGPDARLWQDSVASVSVDGADTVVFTLHDPWATFPHMLATGLGMIVAAESDEGETFTPIGAGPFIVSQHRQGEEITLERRDDYWAGTPHLDGLRFFPSSGGQQQLDAFQAGQLDMFFTPETGIVAETVGTDAPGYLSVLNAGNDVLINNGEGRPGADPRVRQAIIQAIDPAAFDDRTQDGLGRPSVALFSEASRWYSGAPDSRYDPEAARALLDEARADGYDGVITFTTRQAPEAQNRALALQAMLDAVGFDTRLEFLNSAGDLIRVINVEQNYDLGQSGLNVRDAAPFLKLHSSFHSDAPGNASAYSDPRMDELLARLQRADENETQPVLDEIEDLFTETVPTVPLAAQDNLIVWQPNVHGTVHTFADIMLLGQAWKS